MQFHKRGSRYSVAYTTGPHSYLLALEIGPAAEIEFEVVDRREPPSPLEPEIQRQIRLGIEDAAEELGYATQIRKAQFSTADVGTALAFRLLACQLIQKLPIAGAFIESASK